MRKNSGFTLIELMVVIALIVVLSAIAIPNYIAWLPKYRLNSAVDDVLTSSPPYCGKTPDGDNTGWAVTPLSSTP